MCLAIPGKVVSLDVSNPDFTMASVDFGGVKKNICVQWIEVEEGDFILAHAGVAICKVDTEEALITIQTFADIAEALEAEQAQLSNEIR